MAVRALPALIANALNAQLAGFSADELLVLTGLLQRFIANGPGSPGCRNQAFAWGQHVLALQCHPEIRADRFEPWLIGNAGEIAETPGIDARQLRDDTARHGPALETAARRMFAEWLDGVGL